MKKFVVSLLATMSLVVAGIFIAGIPAQAAVKTAVSQSTMTKVDAPSHFVALAAPHTQAPALSGGAKPLSYWLPASYCYWDIRGNYNCYRYGCTNFEIWLQGCYNGYVVMNPYRWV